PTCSAASPATVSVGAARRQPLQPVRASSSNLSCPAVTLARPLPVYPPRLSEATCPAATARTAVSTVAHTWPNTMSLFPRVNVGCGPAEQRLLLTGLHSVADIFCESCKTTLGWKYEQAFETSQKYKEGKYIIEMSHMVKDNGWD
uniref:Protein yippee-like n=1 Tax=Castor canadensis TaxID=51338 RepID=A0A8C0WJ02_CASCN